MMGSSGWCEIILVVFLCGRGYAGERVHKISAPTSVSLPINDETTLTCEMNIEPDRFQWKFYPLSKSQASNPDAPLDLSKANSIELAGSSRDKKKSTLAIKLSNYSNAGDYQCLAHYGASVVASIPDRITVTTLEKFPSQKTKYVMVTPGNTILWRCEPPYSNPPAYIDYTRNGTNYRSTNPHSTSLIITNVTVNDSGTYKCKAMNTLLRKEEESPSSLVLKVVQHGKREMPTFLFPQNVTYTAQKNQTVFLECGAVGNPAPRVTWERLDGILDKTRTFFKPGGLQITGITETDQGVYICKQINSAGEIELRITLMYTEAPTVIEGPTNMRFKKGDKLESDEGEHLDLECKVSGYPIPRISWFLNGRSVLSDNQIEAVGGTISFMAIEKRHAGIIQCFATNPLGTTYSSADLNVSPKQIASTYLIEDTTLQPPTNKKKHKKKPHKGTSQMIPPGKPTVTRLTDHSVNVRWTVPSNDGLPINFFKVQYRELGPFNGRDNQRASSKWMTTNSDIAHNIRSFIVDNLNSNHTYKFRVAAVYSNNDNKLSEKSDKFHLTDGDFNAKNPLKTPRVTFTETINETSIRVYWQYEPSNNPDSSVDGFIISYNSASSAGDYMQATVDGKNLNSSIITHLTPGTVYDIKMQSFNSKWVSEFSPIMKQKTNQLRTEPPETTSVKSIPGAKEDSSANSSLYMFIIPAVVLSALVLSVIVFLIICRKKNPDSTRGNDRSDKPAVEDINHHIQADSNDYVVLARNNGCAIPPNRITITANPLADADNKSQNMIEMSCLTAQNNNCTASASTQDAAASTAADQTEPKAKHKNKRRKQADLSPGENYV